MALPFALPPLPRPLLPKAASKKRVKRVVATKVKKTGRVEKKRKGRGASYAKVVMKSHRESGCRAPERTAYMKRIRNAVIADMYDRVATEAYRQADNNRRATVTYREVQLALELLLPEHLVEVKPVVCKCDGIIRLLMKLNK